MEKNQFKPETKFQVTLEEMIEKNKWPSIFKDEEDEHSKKVEEKKIPFLKKIQEKNK